MTTTLATMELNPTRLPSDPLLPAYAAIGVGLALALPSAFAALVDERTLAGVSVWAKPLKFQASLGLHCLTLILIAGLLAPAARQGRLLQWSMLAGAVATIAEMLYITLQAARGRASHFNLETPLEAALYNLMGVGAVVIVAGSFVLGWLVWRSPRDGLPSGLHLGAALGLMLGSVATLGYAGYLGSLTSHAIGGTGSDAGGLPLVGWSTTGGDLRVAHFLATHTMQVLPLIGLVADRLAPRLAGPLTVAAAILYQALPAAALMQALWGRPVIPF